MSSSVLERDNTTISIATFHEQNQINKFNYEPPYQRHSVWSDEKQSYFIDSILRNFPIPPIFLHRKIDDDTGATTFDVIDGKQRLTSISRFIAGQICASNEYGEESQEDELSGVFFEDLGQSNSLSGVKSRFWKYNLPIEYIDPSDEGLIEMVFDRLNRNGEPLKGQELRNSQYHNRSIYKAITEFIEHPYWNARLSVTDRARMEDYEFVSECLLTVTEARIIGSSQSVLDDLYLKHADRDFSDDLATAYSIADALNELTIDYEGRRVTGVSHLYGFWGLAYALNEIGENVSAFDADLNNFFEILRDSDVNSDIKDEYRKSMNSRTKERFMRKKRVEALLQVCSHDDLPVP